MRMHFTSLARPKAAASAMAKEFGGLSMQQAHDFTAIAAGYRNWADLTAHFADAPQAFDQDLPGDAMIERLREAAERLASAAHERVQAAVSVLGRVRLLGDLDYEKGVLSDDGVSEMDEAGAKRMIEDLEEFHPALLLGEGAFGPIYADSPTILVLSPPGSTVSAASIAEAALAGGRCLRGAISFEGIDAEDPRPFLVVEPRGEEPRAFSWNPLAPAWIPATPHGRTSWGDDVAALLLPKERAESDPFYFAANRSLLRDLLVLAAGSSERGEGERTLLDAARLLARLHSQDIDGPASKAAAEAIVAEAFGPGSLAAIEKSSSLDAYLAASPRLRAKLGGRALSSLEPLLSPGLSKFLSPPSVGEFVLVPDLFKVKRPDPPAEGEEAAPEPPPAPKAVLRVSIPSSGPESEGRTAAARLLLRAAEEFSSRLARRAAVVVRVDSPSIFGRLDAPELLIGSWDRRHVSVVGAASAEDFEAAGFDGDFLSGLASDAAVLAGLPCPGLLDALFAPAARRPVKAPPSAPASAPAKFVLPVPEGWDEEEEARIAGGARPKEEPSPTGTPASPSPSPSASTSPECSESLEPKSPLAVFAAALSAPAVFIPRSRRSRPIPLKA